MSANAVAAVRFGLRTALVRARRPTGPNGFAKIAPSPPTIGRDSADPVSSLYGYGFDFRGGHIAQVVFDIADDAYLDLEAHLAAAMARD